MQYSSAILITAFAATNIFAHGVIDEVQGANGVNMPGLSVIDGTPRDCASPRCGSEADTAIIRNRELGTQKASALGRTQGGGPIDASKMVNMFMSGGGNDTETKEARALHAANVLRRSLGERAANGGTKTPKGTVETGVKAAAGAGSSSGMPTCADDGTVKMTFHQVNQDGAGPLTAMVDGTSGGTDKAAFQNAQVTKNVPGIGIGGLSTAAVMDFPVEVQMPAGMTCDGTVGDQKNVCVMMLKNAAAAGPFGGSVAFVQSPAAKKRAIEYNLRKRNFARALVKKGQEDDMAAALASLEATGSATKAEDGVEEKRDVPQNGASSGKLGKRDDDVAVALASLEATGSATKAEDGVEEKRNVRSNEASSGKLVKRDEDVPAVLDSHEATGSATKAEEDDDDDDEDEDEDDEVY